MEILKVTPALARELWLLTHSELRRLGRLQAVVKWIEQIASRWALTSVVWASPSFCLIQAASPGGTALAYFNSCSNFRPALVDSSFASSVPSLSEFAALKRCSTRARYSSLARVPS